MGCRSDTSNRTLFIDEVLPRSEAARRVLLKLSSRRYPKLVYRLHDDLNDGEKTEEEIAETYNLPEKRYDLERKIERICDLPLGTVYIHCPIRNTSMKIAHALVVGSDLSNVRHLREVASVYREGSRELAPYQDEIRAVEKMYSSIWRFHIYVDAAYADARKMLVASAAKRILHFSNDPLLTVKPPASYFAIALTVLKIVLCQRLIRLTKKQPTVRSFRATSHKGHEGPS